jgi:hypothetical protein
MSPSITESWRGKPTREPSLRVLVLGIGLWVASFLQRAQASAEAMLIAFGLLLLIFGAFAAKLFTRVGN